MSTMEPLVHRYSPIWFYRTSAYLFTILGLLSVSLTFALFIIVDINSQTPISFGDIINQVLISGCAGVGLLLMGNFFPELVSDGSGLHLSFLWKRLSIDWDDILEAKPLFQIPNMKGIIVLRTRSLTPFHRLYGLIYSFSLHPSIIIFGNISHFAELNQRIQASSPKRRN